MNIQETTFGPAWYLVVRKAIPTSAITDKAMYDYAGKKLMSYAKEHNVSFSGSFSVLYFMWDEKNQKAEIGIGFPVKESLAVNDPELSLVEIPQSAAALGVLNGAYDGLPAAHEALMQYAAEHHIDGAGLPVIALEEYVVGPMSESNPERFVTNIYYLHK